MYFSRMMQEQEVEKSMPHLRGPLYELILSCLDLAVPVKAPGRRELRYPLAKKNLDLMQRETVQKRASAI